MPIDCIPIGIFYSKTYLFIILMDTHKVDGVFNMARNIVVEELKAIPISQYKVEVVERKGLGHPDYISDSMMNQISIELSKEYIKRFGTILHHNIDKSLLVAGEAEQRFGGGVVITPMLMVIGDRATFRVGDEEIPVKEIAIKTCKKWIKDNLRFVDPEKHFRFQVELKEGSAALTDIFKRKGKILGANDTSAAVGYAPLTPTEKIVLETEMFLNSAEFKKKHPESGEDIKVMGMRNGNDLNLTIAMAFVDQFINSEDEYFKRKAEIKEETEEFVKSKVDFNVKIDINTLDRRGRGIGGLYLTVTGTSAENADCGQVGRGNRVNGIIPLNRPYSSEAAAGKNPISHVGKIYNVLAHKIARDIYQKVPGIKEVYIWLLSQIGVPVDQPAIAAAQIIMDNSQFKDIKNLVCEVIDDEFAKIEEFIMDLAYGKYPIA